MITLFATVFRRLQRWVRNRTARGLWSASFGACLRLAVEHTQQSRYDPYIPKDKKKDEKDEDRDREKPARSLHSNCFQLWFGGATCGTNETLKDKAFQADNIR